MDFRSNMDDGSAYVSHIRYAFSRKSWFDALPDKEAVIIVGMFKKWLRSNKRRSVYRM
jgi:hypothetical protein